MITQNNHKKVSLMIDKESYHSECIQYIDENINSRNNNVVTKLWNIIRDWILDDSPTYYCNKNIFEAFHESQFALDIFDIIFWMIEKKETHPINNKFVFLKNGMSIIDFLISKNFTDVDLVYKKLIVLENKLENKQGKFSQEILYFYKYFKDYPTTIIYMINQKYPQHLIFERLINYISTNKYDNADIDVIINIMNLLDDEKKYIKNKRYSLPIISYKKMSCLDGLVMKFDTPMDFLERYNLSNFKDQRYFDLFIQYGFKTNKILIDDMNCDEITQYSFLFNNWDPLLHIIYQNILSVVEQEQTIRKSFSLEYLREFDDMFTAFTETKNMIKQHDFNIDLERKKATYLLKMKEIVCLYTINVESLLQKELDKSAILMEEEYNRHKLVNDEEHIRYEKEMIFTTHQKTLEMSKNTFLNINLLPVFNKFIKLFGKSDNVDDEQPVSEEELETKMEQLKLSISLSKPNLHANSNTNSSDFIELKHLSQNVKKTKNNSDDDSCNTDDEIQNSKNFRKIDSDVFD